MPATALPVTPQDVTVNAATVAARQMYMEYNFFISLLFSIFAAHLCNKCTEANIRFIENKTHKIWQKKLLKELTIIRSGMTIW